DMARIAAAVDRGWREARDSFVAVQIALKMEAVRIGRPAAIAMVTLCRIVILDRLHRHSLLCAGAELHNEASRFPFWKTIFQSHALKHLALRAATASKASTQ